MVKNIDKWSLLLLYYSRIYTCITNDVAIGGLCCMYQDALVASYFLESSTLFSIFYSLLSFPLLEPSLCPMTLTFNPILNPSHPSDLGGNIWIFQSIRCLERALEGRYFGSELFCRYVFNNKFPPEEIRRNARKQNSRLHIIPTFSRLSKYRVSQKK